MVYQLGLYAELVAIGDAAPAFWETGRATLDHEKAQTHATAAATCADERQAASSPSLVVVRAEITPSCSTNPETALPEPLAIRIAAIVPSRSADPKTLPPQPRANLSSIRGPETVPRELLARAALSAGAAALPPRAAVFTSGQPIAVVRPVAECCLKTCPR